MPEQKPKSKRIGTAKKVFRWIFTVLLALLLIAGIYFQAPWKALTLIAIFLAALTILPKPARKFFWAGVGAVVIALIIWVFLPDKNGNWRPYTFDKELAALEAKYAIPDSENAAIIYNKLLADYDDNTILPDFVDDDVDDITMSEPWASKDHPELAQWLKEQESTITALMQASEKEKCHFPTIVNPFELTSQTDHLSLMRRWARLLIRAANNDLGEGRIDKAIGKYLCVLQMAKHLYQQTTTTDFLVGFALEALATSRLNSLIVISNATETHLKVIEEILAGIKHNWSSDLPMFVECDKLMTKNLWGIFYEVNPKGRVRFNRNPAASVASEFEDTPIKLSYWQRKGTKTGIILGWFFVPMTPQKAGKIIDDAYERFYAMAQPDFDWQEEPVEFKSSLTSFEFNFRFMIDLLVNISEEFYYGFHDVYFRTIANQRASQLLIALRRYKNETGRWPDSLKDTKSFAPTEIFIDPINSDTFVYKLTEENFTLYSKGKNNIDEGGEYKGNWPEEPEPDDWLIWPRESRTRTSSEIQKETDNAEQR